MRRVVWKYPIPDGAGFFELELPTGSSLAHLGVQENRPYLWVVIDPEATGSRTVRFHARDTGQVFDTIDVGGYRDRVCFLGTYETRLEALGGTSVRHVWAEGFGRA